VASEESLGRVPGGWVIADGFIPSFEAGVFFDSSQSRWAMGLLQISVVFIVLGGGGCRHWGCRAASASTRPRGLIVIFLSLRVLCAVWQVQRPPYPFHTFLYVYVLLYDPYLVIQICTFRKKTLYQKKILPHRVQVQLVENLRDGCEMDSFGLKLTIHPSVGLLREKITGHGKQSVYHQYGIFFVPPISSSGYGFSFTHALFI
jgi:hypothetical protein